MAKSKSSGSIRLNKFIADCGVASRRKADQLIEEGAVIVNGKKVYELGQKIDPSTDKVRVNGKTLKLEEEMYYIMLNKPRGVLTSMSDPDGRKCVGEYFAEYPVRLFPVGRLDWDSEGLLLMTNDGEFAQSISHPKNEITKTYHVKLDKKVDPEKLTKLLKGVSIVGGRVSAKAVKIIRKGAAKKDWCEIIITEGKNRQVRKMFEKIGYDVQKLQRVAIGNLEIGKLDKGKFKALTPKQKAKIFEENWKEASKTKKKKKAPLSVKKAKATESSLKTAAKKRTKKKASTTGSKKVSKKKVTRRR